MDVKCYDVLHLFRVQSFIIPVELKKAVVMFRKILAAELTPLYGIQEDSQKKARQLSDVRALVVLASVCRYWSQILATINRSGRRQLRRLFNS